MADPVGDGYERYLTEKLWEMLPAVYRHEDGIAASPGVLRALVEAVAGQAAILRRGHDRLWEDQFVESCDDWAVAYLGDLVGARLVSALDPRARRIDVAKTIYYRRRKGTLRVLEELIGDIGGWEGTAVESFRRLGRARHGLDPRPAPLAGRTTGTLPGGWADLRHTGGAELAGGPFDEFHHTPDVRRHRGGTGRYAIPTIAFHLYRLVARRVEAADPLPRPDGLGFSIDPAGRDTPLFAPRDRPDDWDAWHAAREWELPGPIRCRLLGHAEYAIGERTVQDLVTNHALPPPAAADLRTLRGVRFAGEPRLRATLAALPNGAAILAPPVMAALLAGALLPDCGKAALLSTALEIGQAAQIAAIEVEEAPGQRVPRELIAAGDLGAWAVTSPGTRLVVDPERGRLLFLGAAPVGPVRVTSHDGFSGGYGAGAHERAPLAGADLATAQPAGGGPLPAAALPASGVTEIVDSLTYGPVTDAPGVVDLTLRAAARERPFLRLAAEWVLTSPSPNTGALLALDGLWVGGAGGITLRGDFAKVEIRHCTLDPGGTDRDGAPIPAVPLTVEGSVEELRIDHALVGPIRTQGAGVVQRLVIEDSVVQARDQALPALSTVLGMVELRRVTVFGRVDVHRLDASEALITGPVDVTDTQAGCFRFSAAPAGSRLPRPYESTVLTDAAHLFTSRRFGDPGYAQLSQTAPPSLTRGAEDGGEIGAFGALRIPIKLDGLRAKVEEYLPFGLVPIFVPQT